MPLLIPMPVAILSACVCVVLCSLVAAYTHAASITDTGRATTPTYGATAIVPANADIVDEVIYLAGNQAVLLSDKRNIAFFLRAQMILGILPQAELSDDAIEAALLDFVVQREWCDRFGIVVSDDSVFAALESRAQARSQTLAQMRNDINALAAGGYEVFYELNRQQMRFAQLHLAIARQEIRISATEIDDQYTNLPEWRTSVLYVLLFAEHDSEENRAVVSTALQNNDKKTLRQWQTQERVRFIEYSNESQASIPTLIVDHLPDDIGKTTFFTTESGYNMVYLQERVLDVPTLREYQLQQLVAFDSAILTQAQQQFGTNFQKAFEQDPKRIGLVDTAPRWYVLDSLAPAVARAVLQTPVGGVTHPIEVDGRWYIASVLASKSPSTDKVKAAIRQRLFASRFDVAVSRWLEQAKQKTYIQSVR